ADDTVLGQLFDRLCPGPTLGKDDLKHLLQTCAVQFGHPLDQLAYGNSSLFVGYPVQGGNQPSNLLQTRTENLFIFIKHGSPFVSGSTELAFRCAAFPGYYDPDCRPNMGE